jgi:glucan 1,3-beta-glucosidase
MCSKSQYKGVLIERFKSSMDFGCLGDGVTDETDCVQRFLNSVRPDEITYFDHGYYIITDTIEWPINIKITCEFWPVLIVMDTGSSGDVNNPKVAFRVSKPGDKGSR